MAAAGGLAGCAAFPTLTAPLSTAAAGDGAGKLRLPPPTRPQSGAAAASEAAATPEAIAALVPADPVDVALPPQPMSQLLNTVFGDILKTPYVLGPDVAARPDIVTLRGAPAMTKRDFFRLVQVALQSYGLKVFIKAGVVNVVSDATAAEPAPIFLTARAIAETPEDERPLSQFFEARTIEVDALVPLLSAIFPEARHLGFAPDVRSNSLVITGPARDVGAAIGVLRQLDQPQFAGAGVLRIEPVYWSADALARQLQDQLHAEGYGGRDAPSAARSVLVAPYEPANQVLVFGRDPAVLERARAWAARIDQPAAFGDRPTTFVFQVQNTDARTLADLVGVSGGPGSGLNPLPPGAPGATPAMTAAANAPTLPALGSPTVPVSAAAAAAAAASAGEVGPRSAGTFLSGRIVVDTSGNRILFTGAADDFAQLRSLLVGLDRPLPQVLVEVTIAEVTLTDQTNLGLEWFFSHSMSSGSTFSGGTLGNLGLGAAGLALHYAGTNVQAAFDAFASNNKVNILSRPRLVARSGSEASIQVGTDVPIITSQANSPTSTNGTTGILQTIEYRQTGVILHVKPLVYGENRVNLEISQEDSSEQPNTNAAIGSPLILNRSVATQLSLAQGETAVLGGLIDDSYTKANSGIPIIKDIPLIGSAFRADTISGAKTELIVLVTPHILHDADDMAEWTRRYATQMDQAFRVGRGWSYTLTPFSRSTTFATPDP